jgi:purine-binding chemotaxis protein CheW
MENEQVVENEKLEEQRQVIVFELGQKEYALFIEQIKEVVLTPKLARVPHSLPYIRGVANIRGNILAIVDLEDHFKLKKKDEKSVTKTNYTLVVESKTHSMGILVSKVPTTLGVNEKDIDYSPNLVYDNNTQRDYIKGIIRLKERIIVLIDIFKIIE